MNDQREAYRSIFDATPLPMWLFDLVSLRFIDVNAAAVNDYGFSRNEFLSMTIREIRPGSEVPKLDGLLRDPTLLGRRTGPWLHRRKDGSAFMVDAYARNVAFEGRQARLVLAEDVTERESLNQSARHLADLVASSGDPIIGVTAEGRVTSWNPAAEQQFGYRADEIVGKPVDVLLPADRKQEEGMILARVAEGASFKLDTYRLCKDGRRFPAALTISPIRSATGEIVGASKIVRDITRRKAAQQLSSTISLALSHELNTPLNGIVSVVELLRKELEGQASAGELLDALATSAGRLHRQIAINLDFARLEVLHAQGLSAASQGEVVPIDETFIAETAEQIADARQRRADLSLQVVPGVRRISRHWLARLLTELLDNAFKFSEPGSPVKLRAGFLEGVPWLEVRDAGRGMRADEVAAIGPFTQFDRTLFEQQGLGIGLYVSQRIVELFGGTLRIDSQKGAGTVVRATLRKLAEPGQVI